MKTVAKTAGIRVGTPEPVVRAQSTVSRAATVPPPVTNSVRRRALTLRAATASVVPTSSSP